MNSVDVWHNYQDEKGNWKAKKVCTFPYDMYQDGDKERALEKGKDLANRLNENPVQNEHFTVEDFSSVAGVGYVVDLKNNTKDNNKKFKTNCKIFTILNLGKNSLVSIQWEVNLSHGVHSGSTEAEAWRAQGLIDSLESAGYSVIDVSLFK